MMDLNTTPRSINPMQQLSAISTHRTSVQLIRTILGGKKEKQSQDRYMFRRSDLKPEQTKPKQQLPLHVSVYEKNITDTPAILDTFPPTPYSTTDKIRVFIYHITPKLREQSQVEKKKKSPQEDRSNNLIYQ